MTSIVTFDLSTCRQLASSKCYANGLDIECSTGPGSDTKLFDIHRHHQDHCSIFMCLWKCQTEQYGACRCHLGMTRLLFPSQPQCALSRLLLRETAEKKKTERKEEEGTK